jgi:hypothetical protein
MFLEMCRVTTGPVEKVHFVLAASSAELGENTVSVPRCWAFFNRPDHFPGRDMLAVGPGFDFRPRGGTYWSDAIDGCIANDRWIRDGVRRSGLPLGIGYARVNKDVHAAVSRPSRQEILLQLLDTDRHHCQNRASIGMKIPISISSIFMSTNNNHSTVRVASLCWLVLCLAFSPIGRGGQFELAIDSQTEEFIVDNPGPAVTPTIYLIGRPDRSCQPVRKTQGLTLDGVRLTETLLSESVLILRPDGTGSWGYHTGFDIFRQPQFEDGRQIDPRTLVEYDKWRYDPMEPVNCVGGDMNLLRIYAGRPMPPAVYEIAFPPPIRICSILVRSNCDQIRAPGVEVRVRLFADRERETLLAERTVGPDADAQQFPVRFDDLDQSHVYVELSADAPGTATVGLYWTFFEADLSTAGLPLPELAPGENRWTLSGDPDGSHLGRLVLRWEDRPAKERVWEDFEGAVHWGGCRKTAADGNAGTAFTGRHFARVTFPANGRDFGLNRSLDELDLTAYNKLGIAIRAVRTAPMRTILVGIKNANTSGYQYVRPRATDRWTFQSFDVSHVRRDRVKAMNVYWMATPGFDRPDEPCIYDVDTISFWRDDPQPSAEPSLPPHVAEYRSPLSGKTPPERPVPPIQEWFPMGLYDGICGRTDGECEWLFDQMNRLKMNAVYISNGSPAQLERILPLAEARGIRLIYQGGGDGALYYLHLATAQARRQSLENVLLPRAREWIPKFRGRWGLAAWSLTEEIRPEMSAELAPYYELVRELAPGQPPTVLHNNLQAAIADLKTNRPLVVTHDFYPFFWSPQSGPSNPRRSISAYRAHVADYYRACREHDASLWMMPQSWGAEETAPLDPPHYGYRRGMRTPQPGEIKLQGWVAVAEGATGLMYYAAVADRPGQHHLWDTNWTETPNTRAAGELFGRLGRVAPLLCRLERDYQEGDFLTTSNPQIVAHSFVKRPAYSGRGRYVVAASLDGLDRQSFDLTVTSESNVYDMVTREEITGQLAGLSFGPGEGTVLLVGGRDDFETDCRMMDGRMDPAEEPPSGSVEDPAT